MAVKKLELYSSLWASCDELRGGMDARQYKDYVLSLLFVKYVSDKYAGQPDAPVTVPEGASFKDKDSSTAALTLINMILHDYPTADIRQGNPFFKDGDALRTFDYVVANPPFSKDGNKNCLGEQEIHRIVDTFTRQVEIPGYARIREMKTDTGAGEELKALYDYLALIDKEAETGADVREKQEALTGKMAARYRKLTEDEIKTLVLDDKWIPAVAAVQGELDRVSQTLTSRIRQFADRYTTRVPQLTCEVEILAAGVEEHLKKMGAAWN